MVRSAVSFAVALAGELYHEWRKERAKARAARQWAETPAVPRGCTRCSEVAYTPGQVWCGKCGSRLP